MTSIDGDELYHILYDGTVMDEDGCTVLGGQAEQIAEQLQSRFDTGIDSGAAIRLGASVLSDTDAPLEGERLEVAMLLRGRPRRAFRRISGAALDEILAAA